MPTKGMQMPNMRFPTGYESEQRKIEMRRKLAQAMMEKGLSGGDTRSWTQALAQVANAYAGKRLEKKATNAEGEMYDKMRGDLADKMTRLRSMEEGGAAPRAISDAFRGDPMMADIVKPYDDAFGSGLKNQEDLVENAGRYVRKGDFVGEQGKTLAGKPTDLVIQRGDQWEVNPVAVSARLLSNPLPPGASVSNITGQMQNPYSSGGGQPPTGPAGGSMPQVGQPPAAGGMDLSRLKPEELQVLQQELGRRAGLNPQAQNFPQGNPLSPPPSKVGPDGKPYWSVGGKWYDNPEGR